MSTITTSVTRGLPRSVVVPARSRIIYESGEEASPPCYLLKFAETSSARANRSSLILPFFPRNWTCREQDSGRYRRGNFVCDPKCVSVNERAAYWIDSTRLDSYARLRALSRRDVGKRRVASRRGGPRLYAPKCLSVYNSIVIRSEASQMPCIIRIVIPSDRGRRAVRLPAGFACIARRDATASRLTRVWLFSLRIRNAQIVTRFVMRPRDESRNSPHLASFQTGTWLSSPQVRDCLPDRQGRRSGRYREIVSSERVLL